jgi:mRNA-degrading endonuclease toxin of MazEF toxin-antitoxin module
LGETEGLEASVANFDNLQVVPKRLLTSKAGTLPASRERAVKRALGYALDWPELKVVQGN